MAKVKELLAEPRRLAREVEEKGRNIWKVLEPFFVDIGGYLLLNETIDIDAALAGCDTVMQLEEELDASALFSQSRKWFEDKCKDSVTPVSYETRVLLNKAWSLFQEQEDGDEAVGGSIQSGCYYLGMVGEERDEEKIEAVKYLGLNMCAGRGNKNTYSTIQRADSALTEFYDHWSL